MAKDSLTGAIFDRKDKSRKGELGLPKVKRPKRPTPKRQRGRPRAFDPFHTFSVMLLAAGLLLQVVALLVYA